MSLAIEIRGVTKNFKGHLSIGTIKALGGVDLSVPEGVIYGFLGPNGAGKTTTLKILTGLIKPDSGTSRIFGQEGGERQIRARTGFLPESPYFYDYLTGKELIHFFGRLFGIPSKELIVKVDTLLDLVGLRGKGDLQLRKYSKGMLQRVGLAQSLINDPELVILDEPMSGLDPIGRREIRDLILSLKAQGKTVFFSSHILADAEMICDEVAILVKGKIARHGSLEELLGKEVKFWDVTVAGWGDVPVQLSGDVIVRHQGNVLLRLSSEDEVQKLIDCARRDKARVISVLPHKSSLEDLFLSQVPGGKK